MSRGLAKRIGRPAQSVASSAVDVVSSTSWAAGAPRRRPRIAFRDRGAADARGGAAAGRMYSLVASRVMGITSGPSSRAVVPASPAREARARCVPG
jgi:hypothetical protein